MGGGLHGAPAMDLLYFAWVRPDERRRTLEAPNRYRGAAVQPADPRFGSLRAAGAGTPADESREGNGPAGRRTYQSAATTSPDSRRSGSAFDCCSITRSRAFATASREATVRSGMPKAWAIARLV